MKVYISGISGTGMGPLALMAKAAGMEVFGTDLHRGLVADELEKAGIEMRIGSEAQNGEFLKEKLQGGEKAGKNASDGNDEKNDALGVDWFVYTSALPEDHVELAMARETGVKCTKRDDFTAFLIEKLGLKLVAVAGTHGKTTTTAMLIWAAKQLGIPAAYIVGTTLGFAGAGSYHEGDRYFIYEADEYDRNFLKFRPWLTVVPAVSYDHPDIYPTQEEYMAAFRQFFEQSRKIILGEEVNETWNDSEANRGDLKKFGTSWFKPEEFRLAGKVRREDAALAGTAILEILLDMEDETDGKEVKRTERIKKIEAQRQKIIEILDEFPGAGRRFERIAKGVYSDYAHHPEEIAATMDVAKDELEKQGFSGLTVIYEPHQNSRQHEVREEYRQAFFGADEILWLPTYLTREDPELKVLTPEELIAGLENREVAKPAEMDEKLAKAIRKAREAGRMVLLLSAGPADGWLRKEFGE